MVDSQEIVERSIYCSILKSAVDLGLTLDPKNYLPATTEKKALFDSAKGDILTAKGYYVDIFGVGNNQARGTKIVPRIVINSLGFFPGEIGFERQNFEKGDKGWEVSERPFDNFDQLIEIRLVANNIAHIRTLTSILNTGIPQRGYIKPYNLEDIPFDGNIFIMVSNFFSEDDLDKGIIEKVYQFTVKDTLLEEPKVVETIVPIKDVQLLLDEEELLHHVSDIPLPPEEDEDEIIPEEEPGT